MNLLFLFILLLSAGCKTCPTCADPLTPPQMEEALYQLKVSSLESVYHDPDISESTKCARIKIIVDSLEGESIFNITGYNFSYSSGVLNQYIYVNQGSSSPVEFNSFYTPHTEVNEIHTFFLQDPKLPYFIVDSTDTLMRCIHGQ